MQKSNFARLFDFGYEDKSCENLLQRFYLYNHQIGSFTEQYCPNSNSYHLHINVDRSKITHSTDNIVIYYESHRLLYYTYYYLLNISRITEEKNKDYTYPIFTKDALLDFEIVCITDDDHLNNILDELYNVKNTIYHLKMLVKYNTDKYYTKEIIKYENLQDELINRFNNIMTSAFHTHNYSIPEPVIPSYCLQLSNHFIVIQNFVPPSSTDNIEYDYNSISINKPSNKKTDNTIETNDIVEITGNISNITINTNTYEQDIQSDNESSKSIESKPKSVQSSPIQSNQQISTPNTKLKTSKTSLTKTKVSKQSTVKQNEYNLTSLKGLTNPKLIEICKEYHYSPYTNKKKEELIRLILSNSIHQE